MHYKKLYVGDFIGAHDLDGADRVLTIHSYTREELENKQGRQSGH